MLDIAHHANLADTWHHQIDTIFIDVEGECNLRCVYCSQSDPDFKPHSGMTPAVLDRAIELARTYGCDFINVTSEGEFTFAKDWVQTAQRLLQSGVKLGCTSNMARLFTADEIGILSRFSSICVSLDTADLKTLRAVRRSADIRTITHNIVRIVADANRQGRRPPYLIINCVLSTRNALSISEFVTYCYGFGAQIVNLSPIHSYGIFGFDKSVLGDERVDDPVAVWPPAELHKLREEFFKAAEIADRMQRKFTINSIIIQNLALRLNESAAKEVPGPGQTRICLHPWELMVVRNNGSVMPCCYGAEDIGNILEEGVDAVMKGERLAALRTSLLTGVNLQPACRDCEGRPIGSVADMRSCVKEYADAKRALQQGAQQVTSRNDPCHCGSGKKFKHCHGQL